MTSTERAMEFAPHPKYFHPHEAHIAFAGYLSAMVDHAANGRDDLLVDVETYYEAWADVVAFLDRVGERLPEGAAWLLDETLPAVRLGREFWASRVGQPAFHYDARGELLDGGRTLRHAALAFLPLKTRVIGNLVYAVAEQEYEGGEDAYLADVLGLS